MGKKRKCSNELCLQWPKWIEKINGALVFTYYIHCYGEKPTVLCDQFNYCPWCGYEVIEIKSEE
jgi:hypothetical protein